MTTRLRHTASSSRSAPCARCTARPTKPPSLRSTTSISTSPKVSSSPSSARRGVEVDAASDHRRPGRRLRGQRRLAAPAPAGKGHRFRVPGPGAAAVANRQSQRVARTRSPARPLEGRKGRRARSARPRRPRRLRRCVPQAALGRHAPAGGDRPSPRLPTAGPADGRAVRRARRHHPRPPAGRPSPHLGGDPQDDRPRDAQRRGGHLPVGPRCGHDLVARPDQALHQVPLDRNRTPATRHLPEFAAFAGKLRGELE